MKNSILLALAFILAFILALASSARADLCPKHKGSAFITSVGECRECKGFTSSGAFKLCKKCSTKLAQCEACSADLKAGVKPSGPDKKEDIEKGKPAVHRAPNGKEFPAHWGPPPRAQTRDLRPLPGGYGQGSGTLATWIQKNLDADAKDPNRGKGADAANPDLAKVKAALEAWAKTREACMGNYSYTVRFQSAFGFGHTTTLVVEGNKIAERKFVEFNREPSLFDPNAAVNPNGYLEKGDAVGRNSKGARALTLDQVYADAAKIAARQLAEHERRYVRVNNDGLLLSCFTVDTRIADDTPAVGINVDTISLAPAPKDKEGEKPVIHRAPNKKEFPAHWGQPPQIQTRDLRPLPGGYGSGSGTLAKWIQMNLDKDAAKAGEKKDLPKPAPKQ